MSCTCRRWSLPSHHGAVCTCGLRLRHGAVVPVCPAPTVIGCRIVFPATPDGEVGLNCAWHPPWPAGTGSLNDILRSGRRTTGGFLERRSECVVEHGVISDGALTLFRSGSGEMWFRQGSNIARVRVRRSAAFLGRSLYSHGSHPLSSIPGGPCLSRVRLCDWMAPVLGLDMNHFQN